MTGTRTILTGVTADGSAPDALALASSLAAARGARVVVATVIDERAPAGGDDLPARGEAARWLRELEDRSTRVEASIEVVRAPCIADGLRAVAARLRPEVVVLGPSHRSAAEEVLQADAASELLFDARWGIAVALGAPHDGAPRRISVGWDGTPQADAALRWAVDLAEASGASVDVIRVIPPLHVAGGVSGKAAQDELRALCRSGRLRVPFSARLVWGDIVAALADLGADGDLLVAGARTERDGHGALFGSVSRQLLQRARCPVVVLPALPQRAGVR